MADNFEEASNNELNKPVEPVQEKMLPQSKVDEIVGREKREAAEKATREANQRHAEANQRQQPVVNMQNVDKDDVMRLIQEHAEKLNQEYANKQNLEKATVMAKELQDRIEAAKPKYEDFDKVMADLDIEEVAKNDPELLLMALHFDNSGEVLYELGKNPSKLSLISSLNKNYKKRSFNEMKALSDSIKVNQQALSEKSPREPLSQITPSLTRSDNGVKSLADKKKLPLYRG